MEKHEFMLKISRLFPSSLTSCQFRNVGDVAESSIPLTKLENDHSSFLSLHHSKRITPPPPTKRSANAFSLFNHSPTSNGGCFTSSDDLDTDTFFSLSSNSCDSFRLGSSSRRSSKRRDQMKSIDETGRRSFSSAASSDTKCSRRATATAAAAEVSRKKKSSRICPAQEPGFDQISTQLYYNGNGGRRGGRNRRRTKKSGGGAVIGDSYAVEKRSSDPHGDFRASMVEMIVEKRIFAAADLERLLRCFLALNSPSYHAIIFRVFSEICETLFTN